MDWSSWTYSEAACVVWAFVGTSAAAIIPSFVKGDQQGKMTYVGIVCACLAAYYLAWSLRHKQVMRVRRGLVISILCHGAVTIITTVVAAFRQKLNFLCQCLLAVAVMAWFHIAIPIFDFGILQFFLRLPLETLAAEYGSKFTSLFLWAGFLVVFGTISSLFVVAKFEGAQAAAPPSEEAAPPPSKEAAAAPAHVEGQQELKAHVNIDIRPLATDEKEEPEAQHKHLS